MSLFLHEIHKPINGEMRPKASAIVGTLSKLVIDSEFAHSRKNHLTTSQLQRKQAVKIFKGIIERSQSPGSPMSAYLVFDTYDTLEHLRGLVVATRKVGLLISALDMTNGKRFQEGMLLWMFSLVRVKYSKMLTD